MITCISQVKKKKSQMMQIAVFRRKTSIRLHDTFFFHSSWTTIPTKLFIVELFRIEIMAAEPAAAASQWEKLLAHYKIHLLRNFTQNNKQFLNYRGKWFFNLCAEKTSLIFQYLRQKFLDFENFTARISWLNFRAKKFKIWAIKNSLMWKIMRQLFLDFSNFGPKIPWLKKNSSKNVLISKVLRPKNRNLCFRAKNHIYTQERTCFFHHLILII